MKLDETTRKQLEIAFGQVPGEKGADCPTDDVFWEAARGRLPVERNAELLDHVSDCARCVEAWKLARALAPPEGGLRRQGLPRGTVPALLAAAAVIALFFFWPDRGSRRSAPDPGFRGNDTVAVVSSIEGETLARDACVLRWTQGPEGAIYRLELSTTVAPLPAPAPILETEFRVPREWLADVAPGSNLFWRVRTSAPGGGEAASPTFVNRLE